MPLVLALLLCAAAPSFVKASEGEQDSDAIKVSENDWPWWRGYRHDGTAPDGQKPPLTWSNDQNVLWKTPVPGRGYGSAAVSGDRIYLAACDEGPGSQSLLCFDRGSGKVVWQTEVHASGAMRKNAKSTGASTTPACDGERVFITFANGDAATATAVGLDGKVLWKTKFGEYQIHQGYASSPAIYRSLLLVSADHKGGGVIAALDRKTGAVVWTHERPKAPNYSSPVVLRIGDRDQLLMIGCDLVSSFDPMTGKILWETAGSTTECVTTTVTDGKNIFSSGGYPKNHLAAITADGTGKVAWETKDRIYVPSLLIREGRLYGVMDAGTAGCWDSATGKELWKGRLSGTFSSSPVLAGNRIYAANEKGETFVFEASPSAFTLLATNRLGDETFSTPSICGGRVYLRIAQKVDGKRQEFLCCLGEK
jgi:outer membrane protein assembly factor BamB